MHHALHCTVIAVCLSRIVIGGIPAFHAAPAARAGLQLRSPEQTAVVKGNSLIARDKAVAGGVANNGLSERDTTGGSSAQQPLIGCPEMWGDPPHSCAVCGGESSTTPGKCKDTNPSGYVCDCESEAFLPC